MIPPEAKLLETTTRCLAIGIVLVCALASQVSANETGHNLAPASRPNIILINLDDAESGLFQGENLARFPNITRLAIQGMRFNNCHVTTPICAPSRYSLLRGQYAHHTGLRTNKRHIDLGNGFDGGDGYFHRGLHNNDLGGWLQNTGYHTMLVGKYYQGDFRPIPKRGWDDFRPWLGNRYHDPVTSRFQDNRWRDTTIPGFRTDLESNDACDLISNHALRKQNTSNAKPFFLYLAPIAPHFGKRNDVIFAKRHRELWPDLVQEKNDQFNVQDVSQMEPVFAHLPLLGETKISEIDQQYRARMLGLKSVDEMIGRIFETLESNKLLDQTMIIFTSDHGFLMGQYRHVGKQLPVQRATNIPLFIWGPGIQSRVQTDELVGHIDITATVLDLAGVESPDFLDGISFESLLQNPNSGPIRKSLLIENWQSVRTVDVVYSALRTKHEIYTEWATGDIGYYDYRTDPNQFDNSYGSLSAQQKTEWAVALRAEKHRNSELNLSHPVVTLARPLYSRSFVGVFTELTGFAEDESGVNQVDVEFETATNKYWNGLNWTSRSHSFAAQLSNQEGLITKWILPMKKVVKDSTAFHSEQQFTIRVTSRDEDLQSSATAQRVVTVDKTAPQISFTRPRRGKPNYAPFSNLGGLISDNNAVGRVALTIQDTRSNQYFDGTAWSDSNAKISAFCNPNQGRWHYSVNLPIGAYEVVATGYDASGNPSTPNRFSFDIVEKRE